MLPAARRRCATSYPSISGNPISSSMTSGLKLAIASNAALALYTASALCPSKRRKSASESAASWLSSTRTSVTRPLTCGLTSSDIPSMKASSLVAWERLWRQARAPPTTTTIRTRIRSPTMPGRLYHGGPFRFLGSFDGSLAACGGSFLSGFDSSSLMACLLSWQLEKRQIGPDRPVAGATVADRSEKPHSPLRFRFMTAF